MITDKNSKYMTIEEACDLLHISRPTLDSYREKHDIKEWKVKGRILFEKREVIEKLYLPTELVEPELEFTVLNDFSAEDIEVTRNVFDVRRIKTVDPFGAISLLCCLKERIRAEEVTYLLTSKDSASVYLQGIRFFQELQRLDSKYVHFDNSILDDLGGPPSNVILPLHLIGYRGGEKGILEELYVLLQEQGFSLDICSSLGWTLGELADNANIHSQGPCYIMLSSHVADHKFLTLTIGDIGVGIPQTIKSNHEYQDLTDMQAFISAFKSGVSGWPEPHRRGKGLNDLLGIAKGNHSWLRAESNRLSLFFDFSGKSEEIVSGPVGTQATGTRYCIVLIDSTLEEVSKNEIDEILNKFLETI